MVCLRAKKKAAAIATVAPYKSLLCPLKRCVHMQCVRACCVTTGNEKKRTYTHIDFVWSNERPKIQIANWTFRWLKTWPVSVYAQSFAYTKLESIGAHSFDMHGQDFCECSRDFGAWGTCEKGKTPKRKRRTQENKEIKRKEKRYTQQA